MPVTVMVVEGDTVKEPEAEGDVVKVPGFDVGAGLGVTVEHTVVDNVGDIVGEVVVLKDPVTVPVSVTLVEGDKVAVLDTEPEVDNVLGLDVGTGDPEPVIQTVGDKVGEEEGVVDSVGENVTLPLVVKLPVGLALEHVDKDALGECVETSEVAKGVNEEVVHVDTVSETLVLPD